MKYEAEVAGFQEKNVMVHKHNDICVVVLSVAYLCFRFSFVSFDGMAQKTVWHKKL